MTARPLRSAAAFLAALAFILISSMPADAAKRQHRHRAVKVSNWHVVKDRKQRRLGPAKRVKRPRPLTGHNSNTPPKGNEQQPQPQPETRATDPMFGVFTDGSPYGGNVDSVDALEGALKRRIDIVNWYQQWDPGQWIEQFHPEIVNAVVESGRIPLLTWEPWQSGGADQPRFRLRRIAEGEFDAYIASWAVQMRDLGHTIYLRPMHEMNGDWYPWGATIGDNSPELFVAAWRRMVDIFRDNGATNVKWVWCPVPYSVPHTPDNELEDYYPGTGYVDVLSTDVYNWGSLRPEFGGWTTFEEMFAGAYKTLAKLGPQPIWIAEVGSAPEGGDKAKWVRDMWATSRTMPRLDAIVWFDQNKEEDWSVMPVASAFAAS